MAARSARSRSTSIPQALQADHLSAEDLENALAAQNQIIPAGTIKVGQFEYNVKLNNSPSVVDELNNLPVKQVNGATIYMRDVAHVADGNPPQRNVVRMDGRRAVLMTVLKSGSVSTLNIVDDVKALLPRLKETLPQVAEDHRPWRTSPSSCAPPYPGVVREGAIAAALDRPDDPAFSGQLALDPDHRDLDPAGDPVLDRAACRRRARPSTS